MANKILIILEEFTLFFFFFFFGLAVTVRLWPKVTKWIHKQRQGRLVSLPPEHGLFSQQYGKEL